MARFRRLRKPTRSRQLESAALNRSRRAEQARLLRRYWEGVDPRQRPRYSPELRTAILAHKYRHRLSHAQVARRFLIDTGTVCEWNVRADETPTPGLLQTRLRSARQGLERAVALIVPRVKQDLRVRLLAALTRLSANIPARVRKTPRNAERRVYSERKAPRHQGPIVATHPNHFWMADFTVFSRRGLADLYLATILDVYSRSTLARRLFVGEPTSEATASLLRTAAEKHGRPKHFVSDRGGQFTGDPFQQALTELGADHRLGAVGEKGTIAIVERLWKTVKEALDIGSLPPVIPDILAERIDHVMDWYNEHRPHQALNSVTPREMFSGIASAATDAKAVPRGRRGEACEPLGVVIRFVLETDRRLPYLERVA